ncbi:immunity 53 family protein [Methylibium sp.]|uniref:immunity 53 family protein n=1 Tax=Methylibium sp. TaxID=2067992 RepID=UPI0039C9F1ED
MDELTRLQVWYTAQCNGDWEHSYGVRIDTLDNPGWSVEVDLKDTHLARRAFPVGVKGSSEVATSWVHCKVEAAKFHGFGGAGDLTEILSTFLTWAESDV